MTEPISVRTEAINTLRTLLGQSTGESGSDEALDTVNSNITNTNSNVSSLNTSVVDLKNSIALLQAQMQVVAAKVNADISSVEVKDLDAPTEEEQAGTSNIVYSVESGNINTNYFLSDSTHYIKHYTYDNLHVIIYALEASATISPYQNGGKYEVATFNDLSSCPDPTNCGGKFLGTYGYFYMEGNSLMIKVGLSLSATDKLAGCIYWFNRSAASKLFTFEDGYMITSNFAGVNPYYATHAYVGNLHFLTIHTKTVQQLASSTTIPVAEFVNNMSIPNANMMGWALSSTPLGGNAYNYFEVCATNNKTIAMRTLRDVPINTPFAIDLIWVDQKATANDFYIVNGTTKSFTSTDKYCKYLKYEHFNLIQVYGSSGSTGIDQSNTQIAKFDSDVVIITPDGKIPRCSRPQSHSNLNHANDINIEKQDLRTFTTETLTNMATYHEYGGYHLWTYLWFA